MTFTWIGQAGLLIEHKGHTLLVDPYLSNSCFKLNPASDRRMPVDESLFDLQPDMILLTHDHLDHTDEETLAHYLQGENKVTVLAPYNAWEHVRRVFGGAHNYVMLNKRSVWSACDLTVYAVRAEHSDLTAVGYMLDDGEHTYYITGDTLYNYDVIDEVSALCPDGVDVVFLPINGVGNNMNAEDAADFATEVGAKIAVPLHFGLFDGLDPKNFVFDGAVIPTVYQEIKLSL